MALTGDFVTNGVGAPCLLYTTVALIHKTN